jgi:tetratricopeptide (TPR) repeat protein
MATDYYYSQHYKEAIEMYELKNKLGKTDKTDPMQIGKAAYMMKDLKKADEVFTKIVAEDPTNIEALLYLARTYSLKEEGGERGQAIPKFESLMQQIGSETEKYKNELSEAYTYMGSYYLQKRDYNVARQWYSKLLNLDPKNKSWQLRALSSDVIMFTNEKNYIQARSTWQKILEIDPNNQDAPGAIRDLTKVINAERNLR